MAANTMAKTVAPDADAERAAQDLLTQNEKLLWAGWGDMAAQVRRTLISVPLFFVPFVGLVLFGEWQSYNSRLAFWSRVPGPHPPVAGFPSFGVVAFLGLILLFVGAIVVIAAAILSRMRWLYAITDRRIIVACRALGQSGFTQSQSFAPVDITCMEIQRRRNGLGDVVFARGSGESARGMMMKSSYGIGFGTMFGLSLSGTRGQSGLYGVTDVETPARLLREMRANRSETVVNTAAAPAVSYTVLPVGPQNTIPEAMYPPRIARGLVPGPQMVFNACPPRIAGFIFAFLGTLFAATGLWNGLSHVLFSVVGLVFAGIGWSLALWNDTLVCSSSERTYRLRRGFFPFVSEYDGTWEDWERIAIIATSDWRWRSGLGMPWKDGRGGGYYIYLLWRDGKKGFPLGGVGGNEFAQQIGRAVAARLDLPLTLEAPPAPTSLTARQKAWARAGKFVIPALLLLTWLNSRFNLVIVEDRWADNTGNRYVRQNSLWRSETHALSQDGEVATYVNETTLSGTSGHGAHLRTGSPDDSVDYRWALRWGIPAAAEEANWYAQREQSWRQEASAVLSRRMERMRELMQPIEQARAHDPGNLTGAVSHALLLAAAGREKEEAYNEAASLYKQAARAGGAPSAADLAAAHLGLGRCHKRDGMRLFARDDFEKAAAVPGCPPTLAMEAHRELSALPW